MFEMSNYIESVWERENAAKNHWQCLIKGMNVKESLESKVGKMMSFKVQSSSHI